MTTLPIFVISCCAVRRSWDVAAYSGIWLQVVRTIWLHMQTELHCALFGVMQDGTKLRIVNDLAVEVGRPVI